MTESADNLTPTALAAKLLKYAEERYEDGYDTFVECGLEYCEEFVACSKNPTWETVLVSAKAVVEVWEERRADAINSAF